VVCWGRTADQEFHALAAVREEKITVLNQAVTVPPFRTEALKPPEKTVSQYSHLGPGQPFWHYRRYPHLGHL
jgi:hypothetical protein